MAANIPGEAQDGGAIWRISPIATRSLPGAIARSTMALRKALRWAPFLWARAPSAWKTWRETFGNGAAISSKPTAAHPKTNPRGAISGAKRVYRGRELEVALQQPARDHARLKCAELFLQRSRLPHRLRVRNVGILPGHRVPPPRSSAGRKNSGHEARIFPANFPAWRPIWPSYNFGLAGVSPARSSGPLRAGICPPTPRTRLVAPCGQDGHLQFWYSGGRGAASRP